MNTQHTTGTWHVGVDKADKIIFDAHGWAVANATVYHGKTYEEKARANARLIAAAPDLLAALEMVYSNAGESPEWIRSKITAAIEKATGGAK